MRALYRKTKRANEIVSRAFDFNPWLQSIASTFASYSVEDEADLFEVTSQAQGVVFVRISGGVAGRVYRLTIVCTATSGQTRTVDWEISIAGVPQDNPGNGGGGPSVPEVVDSLAGSATDKAPSVRAVNEALATKADASEVEDFITQDEADARYMLQGADPGVGVTDHGLLTGLADDDHLQYLTSERGALLFEPKGGLQQHESALDPHAQYLLQQEGDNRYAQLGHTHAYEALGAVTAHTQAADPHSQYMNAARGDARYALAAHGHEMSAIAGLVAALGQKIGVEQKGQLDGIPYLIGGKIPSEFLPINEVVDFLGLVDSEAAMLAIDPPEGVTIGQGDWCIRTDLGTTWILTGEDHTQLSNWYGTSYPSAPVTSVNGQVGAVELTKAHFGLSLVENYSMATMPIPTSVATALAGKSDSSHGHAISGVTGLQAALDGKASAAHTHTIANTTGLQAALDAKAPTSHTHAISSIVGLTAALDSSLRWEAALDDGAVKSVNVAGYSKPFMAWLYVPAGCTVAFREVAANNTTVLAERNYTQSDYIFVGENAGTTFVQAQKLTGVATTGKFGVRAHGQAAYEFASSTYAARGTGAYVGQRKFITDRGIGGTWHSWSGSKWIPERPLAATGTVATGTDGTEIVLSDWGLQFPRGYLQIESGASLSVETNEAESGGTWTARQTGLTDPEVFLDSSLYGAAAAARIRIKQTGTGTCRYYFA